MPWIKIDDQIAHHPKFMAAGALASWLWVCGQSYCARYLTDGFIPESALPTLGNVPQARTQAQILVRVGLWEMADGGYRVHDYHDFQPSRADVEERRRQRAEAGRKGGVRSGHARRHRDPAEEAGSKHDASRMLARGFPPASIPYEPPREATSNPDPGPVPGASAKHQPYAPDEAALAEGFARFWAAYPNKIGKREAWQLWWTLRPSAILIEQLLAAIHRQSETHRWQADEGRYIPKPATWLRQHRWEDETTPAAGGAPERLHVVRGIRETLAHLGEPA